LSLCHDHRSRVYQKASPLCGAGAESPAGFSDKSLTTSGRERRRLAAAMTSRERVLAALAHEQPDRTPCDFWAEPPTWNRLFAHVGHAVKDRLLDDLGVDVRHLEAPAPSERTLADGVLQNFWGERFIHQPTPWGPMREDIKGALAGAQTFAELESFAWPKPDCLDRSTLAQQCRRQEQHALLYGFADVWQRPALLRGW
jgi:uroporphyrinogen decarboxylase